MRLFTCVCACLLTFVSFASADQRGATPSVETEFVGTITGSLWTAPLAINNQGLVVGYAAYEVSQPGGWSSLRYEAFLWDSRSGFRIIAQDARATDINERGDVTLVRYNCPVDEECYYARGAVWNAMTQVFTELGRMHPNAINNRGDIAGMCRITDYGGREIYGQATACVLSQQGLQEWECERDDTYHFCAMWANAVNDRGDIVIERSWEDEGVLAFHSSTSDPQLFPLDGLFLAQGLNNSGTIVGAAIKGGRQTPAAWRKQSTGLLPGGVFGSARAVNNRGWIIGHGSEASSSSSSPLIWTGRTEPTPLAPSGLAGAFDLNDRGQVVGLLGEWPGPYQMVVWRVRAGRGDGVR